MASFPINGVEYFAAVLGARATRCECLGLKVELTPKEARIISDQLEALQKRIEELEKENERLYCYLP